MCEIWFWQSIVSPHMAGLAAALASRGCKVTYVAEAPMSNDRVQQGWSIPALPGVHLVYAVTRPAVQQVIDNAPLTAVHICQGIRGNGWVAAAQRALAVRGLRQWVVMETVDDAGWRGALKRLEYRRLFMQKRQQVRGVLAIGHRTPDWVAARGVPPCQVFPFAYFLPDADLALKRSEREPGPFRFVFAGQLIPRKRVDWLITALAGLASQPFELSIVGTGPEEPALRALASRGLAERVRWLGQLPLTAVPAVMAQADCLVLPSVHDGWGAVASEALMVGTPVICSDTCGAAGVVKASGTGGVFPYEDRQALATALGTQLARGCRGLEARHQLASWAQCLGANAGARYLLEILTFRARASFARPVPPWAGAAARAQAGAYGAAPVTLKATA